MDAWFNTQDEYGRHLLGGGGSDEYNEDRLAWLGDNVKAFEWLVFAVSALFLAVYVRERMFNNSCPWEVILVAFIEAMHYVVDINFHGDSAATILLSNGQSVYWIRYAGWMLTCPVILIHLSHTPEETDQVLTHNLLYLLTSNQAMIIFGVTASFGQAGTRTLFFLLGSVAFGMLCRTAASIYYEALRVYPAAAKTTLKITAGLFFCTWTLYPVFWLLGPEGFKVIRLETSSALHAITDLFAKNLWGYLMFRVREYHLEGVAHDMGISAAEYIRQRKNANAAVDSHFEEWTAGCIAGDSKEVTINVKLQTPNYKAEKPKLKGPKRRSSILHWGSSPVGNMTPMNPVSDKSSFDDPFDVIPKLTNADCYNEEPAVPLGASTSKRRFMNEYDEMTPKRVAEKLSKLSKYKNKKVEGDNPPNASSADRSEHHLDSASQGNYPSEMTRGEILVSSSPVFSALYQSANPEIQEEL